MLGFFQIFSDSLKFLRILLNPFESHWIVFVFSCILRYSSFEFPRNLKFIWVFFWIGSGFQELFSDSFVTSRTFSGFSRIFSYSRIFFEFSHFLSLKSSQNCFDSLEFFRILSNSPELCCDYLGFFRITQDLR